MILRFFSRMADLDRSGDRLLHLEASTPDSAIVEVLE